MSFKDVKNLGEHLKIMGYPKHVPLSIFCTKYGCPNAFAVVYEVLVWLSNRFEPGTVFPGGNRTEADRVMFIRSVSEFLITKAGVKINPRKLYASSFGSAQELTKITQLLLNAPQEIKEDEDIGHSTENIDLSDKIDDLRRARILSSELTNRGAILYDLLTKELVNKEIRTSHANRKMELSYIERSLKSSISSLQNKLQLVKAQFEQSKTDKNNVFNKLQRKTAEYERNKQRLEALQKVKPAYLDEFERLEKDLKALWSQYIIRVRCIDSLRAQLNANSRVPTPLTSNSKPPENSMTIFSEGLIDSDDDEEEDEDIIAEIPKQQDITVNVKASANLRIRSRAPFQTENRKLIGSMIDNNPNLDLLDSFSDDSESVMELREQHLMDRNDSNDNETFSNLSRDQPAQSDEDF